MSTNIQEGFWVSGYRWEDSASMNPEERRAAAVSARAWFWNHGLDFIYIYMLYIYIIYHYYIYLH